MNLYELYDYADSQGIQIENFKFKNIKALYFSYNDDCYIGLDYSKIFSSAEEKCILAEECGHNAVGVEPLNFNYALSSTQISNSRNEHRAKKWAVQHIISIDKLKDLLKKNYSYYEIAEELEVTEEFLNDALQIYRPYLCA